MQQMTCQELLAAPDGLIEVVLLDTPSDPGNLPALLSSWYVRAAADGGCLVYLKDDAVVRAWADKYDQIAAFTGETRRDVFFKIHRGVDYTKEAWEAVAPEGAEARERFSRRSDAYLYELAQYEGPLPPDLPTAPVASRQFELAHGIGSALLRGARDAVVFGFDLSEVMRAFVRFRVERSYPALRERVHVLDERDSLAPCSFDVVHAYHVLQHTEAPAAVLAQLVALLKPQGLAYVIAPFDAVGPEYPEHNPALAHLTVPGLFADTGLTLLGSYAVGSWTAYVGQRPN